MEDNLAESTRVRKDGTDERNRTVFQRVLSWGRLGLGLGTLAHSVDIICYINDTLVIAQKQTHRQSAILVIAGFVQVI